MSAPETFDGHTIFVEEGTYHEHVVVDRSLTLIGENKSTTIIDGDNFSNVVYLSLVENVSISGFTIQNSGSTFNDNGILIFYLSNITVYDNIITEADGVRSISSINTKISNNSITDNRHRGIYLTTSSHNIISGNNLTRNIVGVILYQSHNSTLSDNAVLNNSSGIGLHRASDNTLRSNIMTYNTHNFGLSFYDLEDCINDVDDSNLVDSRHIY